MSGDSSSTNCTPYEPFDSKDYAYVALASAVSGFFTLLASLFVIFIFVLFKRWKYFTQRLVLYLSITAAVIGINEILHRVDYNNQMSEFYLRFCVFGGFLEQLAYWMFLNAIVSITVYLFAGIVLKKDTEKREVLYLLFIFLLPLVISLIPFIQDSYGRSGAWCWIRSEDRLTCEAHVFGQVLIFVLWYIPLYIITITLIVLYVIILIKLRRESKRWSDNPTEEDKILHKKTQRDFYPLMSYPFIFFVLSIIPFINRVQGLAHPKDPVLVLWYLSALTSPLQGGLIAIAYSLDPNTRKKMHWREFRDAIRSYSWSGNKVEEYPAEVVMDKSLSTTYKKHTVPRGLEEGVALNGGMK